MSQAHRTHDVLLAIAEREHMCSGDNLQPGESYFVECEYCWQYCDGILEVAANGRLELVGLGVTIDHVIPRVKGGSDDPDNLVFACKKCNSSKNGQMTDEWFASETTGAERALFSRRMIREYDEKLDWKHEAEVLKHAAARTRHSPAAGPGGPRGSRRQGRLARSV